MVHVFYFTEVNSQTVQTVATQNDSAHRNSRRGKAAKLSHFSDFLSADLHVIDTNG